MKRFLVTTILCLFMVGLLQAQQDSTIVVKRPFFKPSTSLHKGKVTLVTGGILGIYGGALGVMGKQWYAGYERTSFQFFNDGREWIGFDKWGHVWGSYFQSRWGVGMYRWTGMNDKAAIWVGGLTGTFLQSSIEILDAFSAKWGFSYWDFMANMGGSALVISQELLWKEQRIVMKYSAFPQEYPDELQYRTDFLYGERPLELMLKDYNAGTIWLSANIESFIQKETRFPKWLNVAVGYGVHGVYGGFDNRWCRDPQKIDYCDCDPANQVDRSDIDRYAQIYLSLDVDFTRVKTSSPFVKVLLNFLNLIKVPAPTLEFNREDGIVFHPIFF